MSSKEKVTDGVVDLSSLGPEIQQLIESSVTARQLAYCPYSNFQVGASLLSDENEIYTGCNVENVSYGITICAERTAIVKAVSTGKKKFKAIAVAGSNKDQFTTPCGACRQFIREFGSDIDIYLVKPGYSDIYVTSITHLLPMSFMFTE